MLSIDDLAPDALKMDGFDDCIVGVVTRFKMPPIVCYDRAKVIAKNMKGGMTRDEAEEFFEFNQIGAWVGEGTPCFLHYLKCPGRANSKR